MQQYIILCCINWAWVYQQIIIVMLGLDRQHCQTCSNTFTTYNPPRRLINCDHLMCQRCIISQKECPACGNSIGLNDHFLKDYAIIPIQGCQETVNQSSCERSNHSNNKSSVAKDSSIAKHPNSASKVEKKSIEIDEFILEECLLHSKPADLICLDDKAIICSSCALFGKHKGHEVSNREGVLTKFANFVEQCLKIYDDLNKQFRQFSPALYRQKYQNLINAKKESDQKRVSQKFQALVASIRIVEKKELLRVSQFYKQKQKQFQVKQPQIEKAEGDVKNWLAEIQDIGALMSDTTSLDKITDCIAYIDQKSSLRNDILDKGQALLQNYHSTQKQLSKDIDKQKQSDCLQFDEEKVKLFSNYVLFKNSRQVPNDNKTEIIMQSPYKEREQTIVKMRSSSRKEHLRTETDLDRFSSKKNKLVNCFNDDNLLLSVQPPMLKVLKLQEVNAQLDRVQVAQELDAENIPYLSISDIRPVTSSGQSSDRSRILHKDRQLKQFINTQTYDGINIANKDDIKKKKKVEFPQKYKGVVDDLRNDRAETIDLTGAEAGDYSILSLCSFIRKSKKLKTLKLIKNKLTDDCLQQLLESLYESKVCSLNLSQNLLSDKACAIIQSVQISQYLKTITLSLNKINRRNVKNRIDELGKKGITILL